VLISSLPTRISGDKMKNETFIRSAQFIVKRNVSKRVERVLASFDPNNGTLHIKYCTNVQPENNDFDDCELSCAELTAEFTEIRNAEIQCMLIDDYRIVSRDTVVFCRSDT
jgi:hypothetical protein